MYRVTGKEEAQAVEVAGALVLVLSGPVGLVHLVNCHRNFYYQPSIPISRKTIATALSSSPRKIGIGKRRFCAR